MATAKLGPVTVAPLRVEPAYADRDAVRRTILDHAPYPMMSAGAGYGEMMQLAHWSRGSGPLGRPIPTLLTTQSKH